MSDPTIKRCRVVIEYRSSDGYVSETGFKSTPSVDPIATLADAHRETARLLALFGAPEKAKEMTLDAVQAVAEWRIARAQNPEAA